MLSRRNFLKMTIAAGAYSLSESVLAIPSRKQASTEFFGVHPFIENHPEAVFIMKTNVDVKTNNPMKLDAGLAFGRSAFVPRESDGIPINTTIPMKPNMKTTNKLSELEWDLVMSHVADPFFCEGMMEGMKELGIQGSQFHLREVNLPHFFGPQPFGFADMCDRVGADIRLDQDPRF